MKQILITGVNSYIGCSVEQYLLGYQHSDQHSHQACYAVRKVSLRDTVLTAEDLAQCDTVLHVAGLAHVPTAKVSEETKALYYQVNRDLAVETAKKAKAHGVRQFIYLSSILIYGHSAPVGKKKRITEETLPAPADCYADSKWQAEEALRKLETEHFHVAVLRLPMVYGRGSKGNYALLSKLAGKLPVCPDIANERSMIYVEHLAEFIRRLIEEGRGGIFLPQNQEYTVTSQMIAMIAQAKGKKIYLVKMGKLFQKLAAGFPGRPGAMFQKAFGNLSVDQRLSRSVFDGYCQYSLKESIQRTEL